MIHVGGEIWAAQLDGPRATEGARAGLDDISEYRESKSEIIEERGGVKHMKATRLVSSGTNLATRTRFEA